MYVLASTYLCSFEAYTNTYIHQLLITANAVKSITAIAVREREYAFSSEISRAHYVFLFLTDSIHS